MPRRTKTRARAQPRRAGWYRSSGATTAVCQALVQVAKPQDEKAPAAPEQPNVSINHAAPPASSDPADGGFTDAA